MIKYFKNIIRYNFPNLVFLYKRFRHQEFYYDDFLYDIIKLSYNKNFNLSTLNNPVIFDVGSCIGNSALSFLKRVENPSIHCFEPGCKTFKKLKKELTKYKQVKLNNFALGENSKESLLYTYKNADYLNRMLEISSIMRGGLSINDPPTIENIQVEVLDDYFQKNDINIIHILRIDTNTHNFSVLKGSVKTLVAKKIKYINIGFYEITADDKEDPNKVGSLEEINSFLKSFGYRLATFYNGFIHPKFRGGYYTATFIIDDIK